MGGVVVNKSARDGAGYLTPVIVGHPAPVKRSIYCSGTNSLTRGRKKAPVIIKKIITASIRTAAGKK